MAGQRFVVQRDGAGLHLASGSVDIEVAGIAACQPVGQGDVVRVASREPASDVLALASVFLDSARGGVSREVGCQHYGVSKLVGLRLAGSFPVPVDGNDPQLLAVVVSRGSVAPRCGSGDGRPVGSIGRTLPLPLDGADATVGVCHHGSELLPNPGLVHVDLHHSGLVDVGDADGHAEAGNAGARTLLVRLDSDAVAVLFLIVGGGVERENAAGQGRGVLVGAGEGPVDASIVRVSGRVGGYGPSVPLLKVDCGWPGDHGRFVHILDRDGDVDGGTQVAGVSGGYGYGVLVVILVVEYCLSAQLSGGVYDLEVVGGRDAVGQTVAAVGVCGPDRSAKVAGVRFSRMART